MICISKPAGLQAERFREGHPPRQEGARGSGGGGSSSAASTATDMLAATGDKETHHQAQRATGKQQLHPKHGREKEEAAPPVGC